jgi:dUTPase
MKINICLDLNKNLPKGKIVSPQNKGDAGYDLIAADYPRIVGDIYQGKLYKKIYFLEYDTNISIQPDLDEFGDYEIFTQVFPRSSISKYNLALCNSVGVIDSGYRETIKLRFKYIPQPENYYIINDSQNLLLGIDESMIYSKGDKIGQLIFSKHVHPKIFISKKLDETQRGAGGFGSTGS